MLAFALIRNGRFARTALAGLLLLVTGAALSGASLRSKPEAQAAALFSGTEIPHLVIEIADDEMEVLRSQKRQSTRSNVWVTVREGGILYTNVALHLKGSSGSFRAVDQKPALTLSFDQADESQRFHGLQKISLNNSVQDPTFLCEMLGRGMFAEAGIPVPRATHALVELNGRELGLYVLVEGWNKQFLKRHFRDPGGNLYERTPSARDVTGPLEVKSGDQPEDRRALDALAQAVNETDPEKRWLALQRTLDLDRFITSMALEIMIGHWDGYVRNQNNFRLFHDRAQDRLVFLPHGMDQLFGMRRNPVDIPLIGQIRGMVAEAVLDSPMGRARYLRRMEELHARIFDVAALTSRVHELAARLQPCLADDPSVRPSHESAVARLLQRLPQRHDYVAQQLAVFQTSWRPGGKEIENTERWDAKRDTGEPGLTKTLRTLQVSGRGPLTCIGSWRTFFRLEPGRYRFEGKVSVEKSGPDGARSEGVASLRSSEDDEGTSPGRPQTRTNLTHEFSVTTARLVELICQYRGNSGKALFDAQSLKLTRLEDAPAPVRKVEAPAEVPRRRP